MRAASPVSKAFSSFLQSTCASERLNYYRMIMDIRDRFFTFSGFIFYLFYIFLIQKSGAHVETINVVDWCNESSTVNLKYRYTAILRAEEYGPVNCKIMIDTKHANSVVIAFYEYNLSKYDKLIFHDSEGSQLSLSGRRKYHSEERSIIMKGPVTILYVTSIESNSSKEVKFQLVYSVTRGFTCTKDEFQCANGLCLASHLVCDNHNSCGDRSDEKDCNTTCAKGEFRCANRKCIPSYKICDTNNDCGDSSDEEDCNRPCSSEEYKCSKGNCILKHQVCDNHNDCGDWSDEVGCTFDCFYNSFTCHNSKCIESKLVCDEHNDCGDNSDEQDCNRRCYSDEFKCRNHKCIPKYNVCNKKNDCGDMSDEANCGVTLFPPGATQMPVLKAVKLRNPWLITIIVASVILGIIIITFIAVIISGFVADKKKKTRLPTVSANTNVHQVPPPNFFGRMRQSFRSGHQMSAPSQIQQPDHRYPQPVSGPQTYQVPSMYPQLQSGIDNPEFRPDE